MRINFNRNSGMPYTIRTGYDDNGDLVYNDRPAASAATPSAPRPMNDQPEPRLQLDVRLRGGLPAGDRA